MGYTHYWKLDATVAPDRWDEVTEAARRLIESRSGLLSRYGNPSELPIVDAERIVFNGRAAQARETFELRRVPATLLKNQPL